MIVVFIYNALFSISQLHVFFSLLQKTRLTSNVYFFQLIFCVKYEVQSVWQRVNLSGEILGLMICN